MFTSISEEFILLRKGILCFICSHSWLDVGYGGPLQEFFLEKPGIKPSMIITHNVPLKS